MNTVLWRPNGGGSQYAQGWGLSIVVHGFAIGVTIALLSDLHLATRPDPFRWQVSVVGTTHPSAVQETTAAPMEPPPALADPAAPSVHAKASATTEAVSPQSITRAVTPALPPPTAARREHSVEKQNRSTQATASSEALPQVPAPADPSQSTPFTTATSSSILSPPVENRPPASSSEPARSSALSAPASSDEEAAVSPAHTVARAPFETPPAVASIPDARSSSVPTPSESSPVQDIQIGKPDFSWLTDSLRNRVQQSQKYSTVARLNGLEGRVVLRITVKDNGELLVAVATSSGHALLDQDAVEQVTHLSPLPLPQPLGRAQKVLNLPIIYTLNR